MSTIGGKSDALRSSRAGLPPAVSRPLLVLAVLLGAAAGACATGADASAVAADIELTRLLRAMAGLKLLLGAAAVAGVFWRLGGAAGPGWVVGYALAAAALAAGPGLIWGMAHVGAGALLLHGGLFAATFLLWRDPGTGQRIADLVALKRARRPAH